MLDDNTFFMSQVGENQKKHKQKHKKRKQKHLITVNVFPLT